MSDRAIKQVAICLGVLVALGLFCRHGYAWQCGDCFPHDDYKSRHGVAWKSVEGHGLWVDEWGTDPYCTECHGADLRGGVAYDKNGDPVSCYRCHESYPHQDMKEWKKITGHGVYAVQHGGVQAQCQNACHGEDYEGGYSEKSCYRCHELYPHKAKWADQNQPEANKFHGNYVLSHDSINQRTCATQCHGVSYNGGLSGSSCFDCHAVYPHPYNNSRPEVHGILAVTYGVSRSCGMGCHGTDYTGGNADVSCYDCHANFPHPVNYLASHETSASEEDIEQCTTACHGQDLTGGTLGTLDCMSCHGGTSVFEEIVKGDMWP